MQYYDEYQKTTLDARMWRYLDAIGRAGWKGTNRFRTNTSETWILRDKGLISRGYDRDGGTVDVITLKGKWWLHWHRAASRSERPQPTAKQHRLL